VDLQSSAVVVNEAQFCEPVHKEADLSDAKLKRLAAAVPATESVSPSHALGGSPRWLRCAVRTLNQGGPSISL
jgi:hypothetical protein